MSSLEAKLAAELSAMAGTLRSTDELLAQVAGGAAAEGEATSGGGDGVDGEGERAGEVDEAAEMLSGLDLAGRRPESLILWHPDCELHKIPYHPEQPRRVSAIMEVLQSAIFAATLPAPLSFEQGPCASEEQLGRFHSAKHVRRILKLCRDAERASGGKKARIRNIDGDTSVMQHTRVAALRAAGCCCAAVDRVREGPFSTVFCCVRPPGHHAEVNQAMGFCFFNNAAICALHAQATGFAERVAVVDIDVHHGNGTQHGFAGRENLLYISTHQGPDFYPSTGQVRDEAGLLNCPLPAGSDSARYREVLQSAVAPKLRSFRPGLLVISVGFDALAADPLAELRLGSEDFAFSARTLADAAGDAVPIIAVLEGGYDVRATADAAAHFVRELSSIAWERAHGAGRRAEDSLAGAPVLFSDVLSDSGSSWGSDEG